MIRRYRFRVIKEKDYYGRWEDFIACDFAPVEMFCHDPDVAKLETENERLRKAFYIHFKRYCSCSTEKATKELFETVIKLALEE